MAKEIIEKKYIFTNSQGKEVIVEATGHYTAMKKFLSDLGITWRNGFEKTKND